MLRDPPPVIVLNGRSAVGCDKLLRDREVEEILGVLVRDEFNLVSRNSVEHLVGRKLGLWERGVGVRIVRFPQDPVDAEIVAVLDADRLFDHAEIHASLGNVGRLDVRVFYMRPVLVPLPLTVGTLDCGRDPSDAALGPDNLGVRYLRSSGLTIKFTDERAA
jgi:hypothetical protein